MKLGRQYLLFLLIALLCVGCNGTQAAPPTDASSGELENIYSVSHWMQGFKESNSMLGIETSYYEIRRSDFLDPEIASYFEEMKEVSSYAWDARYVLTSVRGLVEERYFLSRQESDLIIGEPVEILTDWLDRPHGYAVCLDIVKEDRTAILYVESMSDWKGEALGYYLVTLGAEGEFLSALDVTETYQGLETSGYTLKNGTWWCDAEGYQYIVTDGLRMAVIDSQGKLVIERECDTAAEEVLVSAFHMADGSLIFSKSVKAENRTKLVWYEFPGAKEHVLWESPEIWLSQFTITPTGVLYYTSGSVLESWDLQTGEKQRLFNFSNSGISPSTYMTGTSCFLTVSGEHELFLFVQENQKIMALTDSITENEDDIVCVALTGGNYVKTCAAAFSREHEETTIRYELRYGALPVDREAQFTRLTAEIAAGHVPDIMVLECGQMELLQEKGILEPLDEYLDKEIVDAMYSGVRETCRVNGALYAVVPEVQVSVLVTSDEIWAENNWTLQDIFDLVDSKELEGLVVGTATSPNSGSLSNLLYLGGYYLGTSPFYNIEKNESYFESEDFIHLLEICKHYGKKESMSRQETLELLTEGKILAMGEVYYYLSLYDSRKRDYNSSFNYVGYPGQAGRVGIYGGNTYYVVVSKNAKDKEIIGEFLNYLMGDEQQLKVDFVPVNRMAIENDIFTIEIDGETYWMYHSPPIGSGAAELSSKDSVSEYIGLLDGAELPKKIMEILSGILLWKR